MSATIPAAPYRVADLFLQALADAGVDYLFTVLGSDHPSIIEAYVRRQQTDKPWPKMLHFQHEFTALSAADGYARVTSKPQCVIVHVDVGTSALMHALHNASSGRAPVLIFAGLAPFTMTSQLPGSRSEHVQWYQDIPNQAALVAPYARYTNEIKCAQHARSIVHRALMMSATGSPGPAYLTAAREVLALPVNADDMASSPISPASCKVGGLPEAAVQKIGKALIFAKSPLISTGYLGRSHSAVHQLVALTNLLPSIRVLDFEFREMSFPADHPSWLPCSNGGHAAIREADVILVLDADVPWIPNKVNPSPGARIFHIDVDPRKEKMQLFDIRAEETYFADCAAALVQMNAYVNLERGDSFEMTKAFALQREIMAATHSQHLQALAIRAQPRLDGTISSSQLFATLKKILPTDTLYLHDAVTNMVTLVDQLQFTIHGTSLSKGGSGLGWAGGAAIGAKLALDRYNITDRPHVHQWYDVQPVRPVCSITGDGGFVFDSSTATYWAQNKLKTPFLTVILNNGGWKATRSCLNDVHPNGVAAAMSDRELGIDLAVDSPDYVGVAVAASNGTLFGRKVFQSSQLEASITEAVRIVQEEQRGALLEVVIRDT